MGLGLGLGVGVGVKVRVRVPDPWKAPVLFFPSKPVGREMSA